MDTLHNPPLLFYDSCLFYWFWRFWRFILLILKVKIEKSKAPTSLRISPAPRIMKIALQLQ